MKEINSNELLTQDGKQFNYLKVVGFLDLDDTENSKIYQFENCCFKDNVEIFHSSLEISFRNCLFERDVELHITGALGGEIDFSDSKFIGKFIIECNNANANIILNKCIFQSNFQLNNSFLKQLIGNNINHFIEENDHMKFEISNSQISGTLILKESSFSELSLENTEVQGNLNLDRVHCSTANFSNIVLQSDFYLNTAQIEKYCLFNGAEIKGMFIAPGLVGGSKFYADFSGATFSGKYFLDNSCFNNIVIKNGLYKQAASFRSVIANYITIAGTYFEKSADFTNTQITNADRETFRFLKNELNKVGNRVEMLHYQCKELEKYEEQLKWNNQFWEKAMLWLNRKSNKHGTDWKVALCFTLAVSVGTFSLYVSTMANYPFKWGWVSWQSFISACNSTIGYYFQFLSVVHPYQLIEGSTLFFHSYIFDFLGRVFIGYGIYQFVQAFRKYGKS